MGIICLSAAMAGWAGLRAMRRFAPVLHTTPGAGWCVLLPAMGFLMVIGMPPTVLVGTGVMALGMLYLRGRDELLMPRVLLALVGALFALAALHTDPAPLLTVLPLPALWALMLAGWWALIFCGAYAPEKMETFSAGGALAAAALLAAPLQVSTAIAMTYDAAIMLSAFAGVWAAGRVGALPVHAAVRMAMGLLLAYLQLDALWRGAWMVALASLAVWLGAIGWAWLQQDQWSNAHAR